MANKFKVGDKVWAQAKGVGTTYAPKGRYAAEVVGQRSPIEYLIEVPDWQAPNGRPWKAQETSLTPRDLPGQLQFEAGEWDLCPWKPPVVEPQS